MSHTILSVAYPFTEVGPDASGGSEQILCALDRLLVEAGHRSIVLAVEGSEVKGELIRSPLAPGDLNDETRRWGTRVHQQLLFDAVNHYNVDLVHMHSLDFHAYIPTSSIPTLATLHLPIDWYPSRVFHPQRRNFFLNCVSASQQKACPPCVHLLPCITNGIDLQSFRFQDQKNPHVVALGRICPEKGFHLALDAARAADVPMTLAGELFDYAHHIAYFEKEIAPRLDSRRRFIGPIGAHAKRELLAGASALLVPSLVAETSSLVTMEALASGTPVIAFPSGAIPELIDHGKTGFLVANAAEMAKAIARISTIHPADCRRSVTNRCDARTMGEHYLAAYNQILKSARTRNQTHVPTAVSWLADVS